MTETGYVKKRSDVWHRDRDCTPTAVSEETVEEAKEKDRTPCLECCPDGWPTEDSDE